MAFLQVEQPGADLKDKIQQRLRELCLHRVDCVYVDLLLSHPATANAAIGLYGLGLFFGGVLPETLAGAFGDEVLRLQYLNETQIYPDDVHTASDFGRELLDLVLQQKDALG